MSTTCHPVAVGEPDQLTAECMAATAQIQFAFAAARSSASTWDLPMYTREAQR